MPPFLLVVIPLLFIYKRIQSYYLATSREIKRIDAVTKSPIFAMFGETLMGVATIRALSSLQRAALSQTMMSMWIATRKHVLLWSGQTVGLRCG